MSIHPVHFVIVRTILLILIVFYQDSLPAHVEQHHETKGVGIDERLGHSVPLDLTFREENGKPAFLKELVDRPTILAPVFFSCPDVCSFLLSNLSGAMNRLPAEPGKDFLVLAVSF